METGTAIKWFAIYDNKDMIRFVGNTAECARWLGITVASFYSRVYRSKHEHPTRRMFTVYEVEND